MPSMIARGAFSLPSTPNKRLQHEERRPPLPLADGLAGTPSGHWATSSSVSLGKAATPGGSSSARAAAKRQHEIEAQLWKTDQKLLDTQAKLTAANLQLSKEKAAAESQSQSQRQVELRLEREQRKSADLADELEVCKHSLKTAKQTSAILGASNRGGGGGRLSSGGTPGGGRGSVGGVGGDEDERVLLLRARLEEANERARAFQTESASLRDEVSALKTALHNKGGLADGALQQQLAGVKAERMRLALELHEAKSTAKEARAQAADAHASLSALDGVREALNESRSGMAAARAEAERLALERAQSLSEHGEVLSRAKELAGELESTRASHAQLAEQKLALLERLTATEHTLTALRNELARREGARAIHLGKPSGLSSACAWELLG